jgi:hypothetical protein
VTQPQTEDKKSVTINNYNWAYWNGVSYHKEAIHDYIKEERGKLVAWITVVPQKDLYWNNSCGVQKKNAAGE